MYGSSRRPLCRLPMYLLGPSALWHDKPPIRNLRWNCLPCTWKPQQNYVSTRFLLVPNKDLDDILRDMPDAWIGTFRTSFNFQFQSGIARYYTKILQYLYLLIDFDLLTFIRLSRYSILSRHAFLRCGARPRPREDFLYSNSWPRNRVRTRSSSQEKRRIVGRWVYCIEAFSSGML